MEWALSDADTRRHHAEHSCEVERSETKAPPTYQAPPDLGRGRRGWDRRVPGLLPVGEQSTRPVREEPRKRPSPVGRSKTPTLQLRPADVRPPHAGDCQVGGSRRAHFRRAPGAQSRGRGRARAVQVPPRLSGPDREATGYRPALRHPGHPRALPRHGQPHRPHRLVPHRQVRRV